MKELTKEEIEFLQSCNLYQLTDGGLIVLTENDEGSRLDKSDIETLIEIFKKIVANPCNP